MEEFTQEDLDAFKEGIVATEVNTQPIISDSFPFESLLIEFESGNSNFIDKLNVHPPPVKHISYILLRFYHRTLNRTERLEAMEIAFFVPLLSVS